MRIWRVGISSTRFGESWHSFYSVFGELALVLLGFWRVGISSSRFLESWHYLIYQVNK